MKLTDLLEELQWVLLQHGDIQVDSYWINKIMNTGNTNIVDGKYKLHSVGETNESRGEIQEQSITCPVVSKHNTTR